MLGESSPERGVGGAEIRSFGSPKTCQVFLSGEDEERKQLLNCAWFF